MHEEIKLWWNSHMEQFLPDALLSDQGFMAYSDEKLVATMFFFPVVGCKMAMLGYPIANPKTSKEERKEALSLLISTIEAYAKNLGYEWLVSYPGNPKAQKLFENNNYIKGDSEVIQFLKKV